jgi:hypothetical protein
MPIKSKGKNRIRLEDNNHEAAVSLEWYGKAKTWLLTEYQKQKAARSMNVGGESQLRPDETTTSSVNPVSNIVNAGDESQEINKGMNAVDFALKYHKDQKYNGQPYVEAHLQPVFEMSKTLWTASDRKLDFETLGKAAFLHDVMEDTDATYDQVKELFGQDAADACQLLDTTNKTKDEYYAGIATSPLAKLIKAADRLVNLKSLAAHPDVDCAAYLKNKYRNDLAYYEKYDIYPDLIKQAVDEL